MREAKAPIFELLQDGALQGLGDGLEQLFLRQAGHRSCQQRRGLTPGHGGGLHQPQRTGGERLEAAQHQIAQRPRQAEPLVGRKWGGRR
jgi:hypothetical protein